jgi:hypothetical protein
MDRELIHGLQLGAALLRPKFPVSVCCCAAEARLLDSSMGIAEETHLKSPPLIPASGKSKAHKATRRPIPVRSEWNRCSHLAAKA